MDITINKIAMDGMESLKVSEGSAVNQSVASESLRAEEERRQTVDNQQVKELTENLQGYVDKMNINVAFSTYGEKNKTIISVSEKETGKLIREIPPKELRQLHVKMEELAGMILNGIA